MDKIVIEYQSQDSGQLSRLLIKAVMGILKESGVNEAYIRQDGKGTGSRSRFLFTGFGGGRNGL